MFGACAGPVGAVYPFLIAHTGGQGLPCPLRTLTGVPCPFCGMTTATVAITHGNWAAAAGANPFAYLVAAPGIGATSVVDGGAAAHWPARGMPGRGELAVPTAAVRIPLNLPPRCRPDGGNSPQKGPSWPTAIHLRTTATSRPAATATCHRHRRAMAMPRPTPTPTGASASAPR